MVQTAGVVMLANVKEKTSTFTTVMMLNNPYQLVGAIMTDGLYLQMKSGKREV